MTRDPRNAVVDAYPQHDGFAFMTAHAWLAAQEGSQWAQTSSSRPRNVGCTAVRRPQVRSGLRSGRPSCRRTARSSASSGEPGLADPPPPRRRPAWRSFRALIEVAPRPTYSGIAPSDRGWSL
jgi:hypothetical protein